MLGLDLEIRILELALSRGLLARGQVDAMRGAEATEVVRWGPRLDLLLEQGVLGSDLLDALAWEAIHLSPARAQDPAAAICPDSWVPSPYRPALRERDALPEDVPWTRYQDLSFLGIGGAARVYRAFDPVLQREVALKFVRGGQTRQRELLLKEARAQAKVDHPNVCKVFEVGDSHGFSFISMQLVHGQTLTQAMGGLDLRAKVSILRDVAEGVHAGHRRGLVHLDLKPGNILLEPQDGGGFHPFVTDFGLVADLDSAQGDGGEPVSLGTPPYSSPEQVRGFPRPDRRADVYALGATLYALLSGQPPFRADTFQALLEKMSRQDPPSLRNLAPDLPGDLVAIVEKCMAKERGKRYSTALALSEDLQRFLDGEPVLAQDQTWIYRARTWFRKNRTFGLVACLLLLLAAGLGAFSYRTARRAQERARLAQRFGQEVEATEALARYAHLQQVHDIRPELQTIAKKLQSLEIEIRSAGPVAAGPGHHALGRGYLALEQPEKARAFLDQAAKEGETGPEFELDRGRALAALYTRELAGLAAVRNPEKRKLQEQRFIQELRKPALEHFRRGREASPTRQAYLEGRIAMYEERYPEALALARAAQERDRWFYEALLLEGQVALAEEGSTLPRNGGPRDGGEALLARAQRVFEAAALRGPSDPEVYRGLAEVRYRRMVEEEDLHPDRVLGTIREGLEILDRGLQVQPDHAELHRMKAAFCWVQGEHLDRSGQDAAATFREARREVDLAVAAAPEDPRMHKERANVLGATALWMQHQGRSALEPLSEALRSLRRAVELGAMAREADNALGWLLNLQAAELLDQGQDPRPSFRQAIDAYREVLAAEPKNLMALSNLGLACAQLYELDLEDGKPEESRAEQGSAALQQARQFTPDSFYSFGNGVYLCRLRARAAREAGKDGTPWIQQAVTLGEKACELGPDQSTPRMELAAAQLEGARCDLAAGRDPGPRFAAASWLLADGIRRNPKDPDIPAVEAESWWMHAERGEDPPSSIEHGLAAADRALKINARNHEARALRGSFLLAKGRAEAGSRRAKDLAQAAGELELALQGNPFLRRRYGARLAEARKG